MHVNTPVYGVVIACGCMSSWLRPSLMAREDCGCVQVAVAETPSQRTSVPTVTIVY